MKTGIYLVTLLILLNDNRCLFSDAKPTKGSRGDECGEGQFYNRDLNKCMPCSDICNIREDLCRRHECLAPPKVQVKCRKTNVTEGESVQLECSTSGGIPESIKRYMWVWKTSDSTPDQVLQDTYTKTSTGNGKFLVFSPIRYDQSGLYTCRAWNIGGMGQGSIDIDVLSPKISVIGVSREDIKVAICWKQVIGHYTAIKVKYCQTGTEDCEYYITPRPNDTSASLLVPHHKTYYYYVMIEDGDDVVYTSDRLVAKTDMAPKMSVIGVSRTDNTVTIRWKKVIGHYTAIKIRYCQTGTDDCVIYIVPNPEDTSATWFVDPDKTYYYYMVIEDDGDVVYTSNPLVVDDAKINIVAVVGGSVTGAVIMTASGVILAVALWKSRRSGRKLKNQVAYYTNDDDVTRTALDAIKNSPRHTYANIGTASVNNASSHSARRTAKKYPVNPRAKILYGPANRVRFDDVQSASSHDDEDIDHNTEPMCRFDKRWRQHVERARLSWPP